MIALTIHERANLIRAGLITLPEPKGPTIEDIRRKNRERRAKWLANPENRAKDLARVKAAQAKKRAERIKNSNE
jgi:hypothetical protein